MLRFVLVFGLFANMATAQDAALIVPNIPEAQACLDVGGDVNARCFGATIDACLERAGHPAIIPPDCWQHEALLWSIVVGDELKRISAKPQVSYPIWEDIRDAHQAWLVSYELECRVRIMSNPRTSDLMPACRAQAMFDKLIELRDTRGADWTEY